MIGAGDSFVVEDFLRATRDDVALWVVASLVVIAGLVGCYWAYQTFVPVGPAAAPPAGAIVVEFAEFTTSPVAEELDVSEGERSVASEPMPFSEAEPDPEAVPEPAMEPEKVVQTTEAKIEPPQEPPAQSAPEPLPAPEPELPPLSPEPMVQPTDPNIPIPAVLPQRLAEVRANTPATNFEPPPRRVSPPQQQAATQASAPKPQAQQASQASAPQPSISSGPSASQVNRWETAVFRHLGQRRKIPPDARRRGETGRVLVQFTIDIAGNVRSVSISRSSGFASLDQAALDLVRTSSPVPRPPDGLPAQRLSIGVPIDYGL
jgi:protein TonB